MHQDQNLYCGRSALLFRDLSMNSTRRVYMDWWASYVKSGAFDFLKHLFWYLTKGGAKLSLHYQLIKLTGGSCDNREGRQRIAGGEKQWNSELVAIAAALLLLQDHYATQCPAITIAMHARHTSTATVYLDANVNCKYLLVHLGSFEGTLFELHCWWLCEPSLVFSKFSNQTPAILIFPSLLFLSVRSIERQLNHNDDDHQKSKVERIGVRHCSVLGQETPPRVTVPNTTRNRHFHLRWFLWETFTNN